MCGHGDDALERALALERELQALSVDMEQLDMPPADALRRPALKTCRRFIAPRAPTPVSAAAVAQEVRRLVDLASEQAQEWEKTYARAREDDAAAATGPRHDLILVMDGLRSTQNVGSLLRACEAAHISEAIACGITPMPPDPAVIRAAGGAEIAARTPQRRVAGGAGACIAELQRAGYAVWAVETTTRAVPLSAVEPPARLAIVLGNERLGVSVDACDACQQHVRIPTRGMKNSLNVAVVGSMVMFDIVRRMALP